MNNYWYKIVMVPGTVFEAQRKDHSGKISEKSMTFTPTVSIL